MFNVRTAAFAAFVIGLAFSLGFMGCERRTRPPADTSISGQNDLQSAAAKGFVPYAECENVFGGIFSSFRVERDSELKQSRIKLVHSETGAESILKSDTGEVVLVSDEFLNNKGKTLFVSEDEVEGWPMQIFMEFGREISSWDLLASWGDIMRASYDYELNQPSGYQCKAL